MIAEQCEPSGRPFPLLETQIRPVRGIVETKRALPLHLGGHLTLRNISLGLSEQVGVHLLPGSVSKSQPEIQKCFGQLTMVLAHKAKLLCFQL